MKTDQPAVRQKAVVGARRRARQFGLTLLYAADVSNKPLAEVIEQARPMLNALMDYWQMSPQEIEKLSAEIWAFGCQLASQYLEHAQIIDRIISAQAEGWRLERMPVVDRNILRLALGEMWYLPEVPIGVTIDEAVELAKEFATAESSKFINGILGAVARQQAPEGAAPGSCRLRQSNLGA